MKSYLVTKMHLHRTYNSFHVHVLYRVCNSIKCFVNGFFYFSSCLIVLHRFYNHCSSYSCHSTDHSIPCGFVHIFLPPFLRILYSFYSSVLSFAVLYKLIRYFLKIVRKITRIYKYSNDNIERKLNFLFNRKHNNFFVFSCFWSVKKEI